MEICHLECQITFSQVVGKVLDGLDSSFRNGLHSSSGNVTICKYSVIHTDLLKINVVLLIRLLKQHFI